MEAEYLTVPLKLYSKLKSTSPSIFSSLKTVSISAHTGEPYTDTDISVTAQYLQIIVALDIA